jgi:hypothetical protein
MRKRILTMLVVLGNDRKCVKQGSDITSFGGSARGPSAEGNPVGRVHVALSLLLCSEDRGRKSWGCSNGDGEMGGTQKYFLSSNQGVVLYD